MLFNTLTFLVFFPLTTAIYFLLPHRQRWAFLLACSCLFYAAYVPAYLLILALVIAVDYVAGLLIDSATVFKRRAYLAASLVTNVGILALFKYYDFINANLHSVAEFMHWNYPVRNLGWVLPIGLSFHTFQSMSYTIEVYLGRQRAERHLGIYSVYVMFYPQLVAGPIERPQNLLHQFRAYHAFDADRIFRGLRQMLWGFFKKVVVADRMAAIVDGVYHQPQNFGAAYLWLAAYCFAFQIYCDFSGYSDIALGAARVLGIKLMTNFDRPYAARNVAEFWRRWHISLSTWFRDYVYVPLGGNRVALPRWCVNVLIVFVISGLWHGASWTFIIWGALHGIYLIIGRLTSAPRQRLAEQTGFAGIPFLRSAWQIFFTFNLVAVGWVFFRATSFHQATWVLHHMVQGPLWLKPATPTFAEADIYLGLALVLAMELVQYAMTKRHWAEKFDAVSPFLRWPAYYAIILTILWIGDLGGKTFIYFQF